MNPHSQYTPKNFAATNNNGIIRTVSETMMMIFHCRRHRRCCCHHDKFFPVNVRPAAAVTSRDINTFFYNHALSDDLNSNLANFVFDKVLRALWHRSSRGSSGRDMNKIFAFLSPSPPSSRATFCNINCVSVS